MIVYSLVGRVPLHLAVQKINIKFIHILIENVGNGNLQNKEGKSSLYYAKDVENIEPLNENGNNGNL